LNLKLLEATSLVYRLPGRQAANIKRILDIPELEYVIKEQNLAGLYQSGWLEDMVYFLN
jgi:hypothetical protein